MSAKLIPGGCTFPTECKDSIITIHAGTIDIRVEVPWLHQEFALDNSYYHNDAVLIHLLNNKYRMVFRRDGTVTGYNLDNYVVIERRWIPIKLSDYFTVWERCSVINSADQELLHSCKVLLSIDEKSAIIDTTMSYEGYSIWANENEQFIMDIKRNIPYYPLLLYNEEGEEAYYTKVVNRQYYYRLNGSWIKTTGVDNFL